LSFPPGRRDSRHFLFGTPALPPNRLRQAAAP